MNRLILLTIALSLALAAICSFPAVPAAADPILVEQYIEISVQATRGGQPYEEPMSFTIECFSDGYSRGSVSISCQYYPCKQKIPVSSDTSRFGGEGTYDCRILAGASGATSILIPGQAASMVCGPELYRTTGEYTEDWIKPCTVTLDLSAKSASLFVVALLLAFLVEIPIVWLLVRFVFKPHGLKAWRVVAVGLVATGLTLPVVWFVVPGFLITWPAIVVGELLVVAVEGVIYAALLRVALPQAMALSLVANAASFVVGLLVL